MPISLSIRRSLALAMLAAALFAGGCANQQKALEGGAMAGAATPGSSQDFQVNVGDRVFFETDSATIRGDQRPVLERQARWMGQHQAVQAMVEGHADERGTREYNLALGQRRANAARDVLVANGVSGGRVSTISYGKDRPTALGSSEDAWAQNRRAVTVVR